MHLKSYKLGFDTYEALFRCQVAGLYHALHEILVVKGIFKILIYVLEVGIEDFCNVAQLTANATGLLCLMSGGGRGSILHISGSVLE